MSVIVDLSILPQCPCGIIVVVVVVVKDLIPVERIIGEYKKSNNSRPTGFTETFDKIGARVINIKSRLGFER